MASRLVRSPTWEISMAILRSSRRRTTFRPNVLKPAFASSRQPSPKVPGVVGQLEDPDAEGVKGVDEIEIGLDRIAALKVESDGELAVLLGLAKIGNGGGETNRVLTRMRQVMPVGECADGVAAVLQRGDGRQNGVDPAPRAPAGTSARVAD